MSRVFHYPRWCNLRLESPCLHSALESPCLHSCYDTAALHSWKIPWFIALPLCFFPCCSLWKIPPEGSGVFPMVSLILSQRSKWTPFSKDCWASGKQHWRSLGGSWCYLCIFRDRDSCTAEAEQRQLTKLMHEMVRLSSDAKWGQPAISTGFGTINFQEP